MLRIRLLRVKLSGEEASFVALIGDFHLSGDVAFGALIDVDVGEFLIIFKIQVT